MNGIVYGLEGKPNGAVSEGGANLSVGQRQFFCLATIIF